MSIERHGDCDRENRGMRFMGSQVVDELESRVVGVQSQRAMGDWGYPLEAR